MIAPRRGGRRRRPGVLGRASGSGSTAATRTTRPGRSCRTSTRRGCCRCSRRGRCCRGTSPGSSGAAATILLLLWTIHWAYRRRPLTTAVIVAVLAFPFGANLDTGNINLQLTLMLWAAQFTGPRLGRPAVGARDLDEVGPGRLLADPAGRRANAGDSSVPGGLVGLSVADAAADDHPAPGAVRVRRRGRSGSTTWSTSGRSCRGSTGGPIRSTSCDRRPGRAGCATPAADLRRLAPG